MIKGSIQEEDFTLINTYVPNIGALNYIKQILTDINGEIDRTTIIVGDFYTPLTAMGRSSRLKISSVTEIPNSTIQQLDLNDIFRTLHPKKNPQNTYSSAHGTFSRIDHMLGQKTSLNKFKIIEIISSIFANNDMKLKINYRKRNKKKVTTWRLNMV